MMSTGFVARVAAPPIAGFLLVAAYVVAEALGFSGLARPEAATVSEAAAMGQAAQALQLIAEGQDANGRHRVREELLDHASHELTPIEAAILGRHAELVRLLQRTGATRWDAARTACFARMRLPEVLADLGASSITAADSYADVETTIRTCPLQGAAL
jgi:hypothetical protein